MTDDRALDQPAPTVIRTVAAEDTAAALGSGDVPVLATPRLLAWLEAATVAALADLPAGITSVGTAVQLEHLRPSAVGTEVHCHAAVTAQDDRSATLSVMARAADGTLVACGTVTRALVNRERFLDRLPSADQSR